MSKRDHRRGNRDLAGLCRDITRLSEDLLFGAFPCAGGFRRGRGFSPCFCPSCRGGFPGALLDPFGLGCVDCGSSGSCGCDRSGSCCPQCGTSGSCDCGHAGAQPCWMPERLAPVHEEIGHGHTLRVRFRIDNRSLERRTFVLAATGEDADLARGGPSTAEIDPQSRGELLAKIRVPSRDHDDRQRHHRHRLELTLWVRGCQDFVTPVRIRPVERDFGGDLVVRHVVDQPDTQHTYRDHFSTSRSCAGALR